MRAAGARAAGQLPERPELARRIDPMVVIRWKDIFDTLESAADACEHVAPLIEGIELRRDDPPA